MSDNIAKSFATMTLLYWKPEITGAGLRHEQPVEFKGFYIADSRISSGNPAFVFSGGTGNGELVLFYLCKPEPQGYVSWGHTLASLEADGKQGLSPTELTETRMIKSVTMLPMPGTKTVTLANTAYLAHLS